MFDSLAQEIWERLEKARPKTLLLKGEAITAVPDLSIEATAREASAAETYYRKLQAVPKQDLSFEKEIHRQCLLFEMDIARKAADYADFQFSIAPNSLAFLGALLPQIAIGAESRDSVLDGQHAHGIEGLGNAILELESKTRRQYKKGILLPLAALDGVSSAIDALRTNAARTLTLSTSSGQFGSTTVANVNRLVSERIAEPLNRIIEFINSDDYRGKAPSQVGIAQYAGGEDAYQYLLQRETSSLGDVGEIRERGAALIEQGLEKLTQLRSEIGIPPNTKDPVSYMRESGRFACKSPEEVEKRFVGFLESVEAKFLNYFIVPPTPGYRVERLNPDLEQSLTFGYFQIPTRANPNGTYFYNGSNLSEKLNISHAALVFHELIPGHHYQMASQLLNEDLPLSRRFSLHAAYNEGWAEYASSLGIEMGLYEDPADRYGRYLAEVFLGVRMVVDTGLNTQELTVDNARGLMRQHSVLSNKEIDSEILRYSTDMPAQALAYGCGFLEFWDQRRKAQRELGTSFDLRAWHDEVLSYGSIPLPVLAVVNKEYISGNAES